MKFHFALAFILQKLRLHKIYCANKKFTNSYVWTPEIAEEWLKEEAVEVTRSYIKLTSREKPK